MIKNNKDNTFIKKNKSLKEKKNLIKKILKFNKFKIIFKKKYITRYITFCIMLLFLAIYLFIGAITTEWNKNVKYIEIINYIFIGINIIILFFINYEILLLVGGIKWPIYTQIITYLLIFFLFLFPTESVTNEYNGIGGSINYPFYTLLNWNWLKPWIIFIIYLCVILIYYCLLFFSKKITFSKITIVIIFILYLIFSLKTMNKFMLNFSYGWSSVLWLILIVILTDTFSFIGCFFSKNHKLAPKISPNKTLEGAIIGTVFATIIAFIYAILMFNFSNSNRWVFNFFSNENEKNIMRYIIYFLLSFLLSVLSQLGDLLFSWIKRCYNIKDFSNLLPGHGGILDRLDSFSLVFFAMFIISNIVLQQ